MENLNLTEREFTADLGFEKEDKMRGKRYWAIRTDKENRSLLLKELLDGRLRQGWGYDSSQNLELVQKEISKGGEWWNRISETQGEVLRHLRMLSSSKDSVQVGDWIVVPNLPENGFFFIVEIVGKYYYDPIKLSQEQDINKLGQDYGHVLPIKVLTKKGINKYSDNVHADIRRTLKVPMRMWNLDGYYKYIEKLVFSSRKGGDLSKPLSSEARLDVTS